MADILSNTRTIIDKRRVGEKLRQELPRSEAILEAVGFASEQFLRAVSWRDCAQAVLDRLGEATDVSRVYLFEGHYDNDGQMFASQKFEWTAAGIEPQINNEELQNIPLDSWFPSWLETFHKGRSIFGVVSTFDELEREFLEMQGIQSIMMMPVMLDERFWGMIGFDDCKVAREWKSAEVDALKIASSNLSAAIELARSQDILLKAQKLETIGLLAGNIAHDFNNLLTGVIGQTSLALIQMSAETTGRRQVSKALYSAERAAELTRQLLIYAGKGQLELAPVDINLILTENSDLLKTILPTGAEITFDLQDELGRFIGDPVQIQQIIVNLIVNAGDALVNGVGEININTRRQLVTETQREEFWGNADIEPGAYIRVEVGDNGIGMPPAVLNQIFDPFFTTKQDGHGLGLATTLGVIRAHKGGLQVDSSLNDGTRFVILFPAYEPKPPAPKEINAPVAMPHLDTAETVLIIDDQEVVREAVNDMLELNKIPARVAKNGQEGLDIFIEYQEEIGLVLLDANMPGLSGTDTYQALIAHEEDLKVIVCSGYSTQELERQFGHSPKLRFLQKPFDFNDLLSAINDAFKA